MQRPSAMWRSRLAWLIIALLVLALTLTAGERVRELLLVGLTVGGLAAMIAATLGALLALILTKTDTPCRGAVWLLLAGLMLAPLCLHAAAWQAGFGLLGWATQAAAGGGPIDPLLAGLPGAVWVHAMAATPWSTLIIAAALRGVSRNHEESALLETSAANVLRRITAQRAAIGVTLAGLWTTLTCSAEISVTDLFGVRTFAEEVYTQASLGAFGGGVAVDGSPSLSTRGLWCGVALLVVAASAVLANGARHLIEPNDQEPGGGWRWRLGRAKPLSAAAGLAVMLLIAGVPIANLAYKASVEVTKVEDEWRRGWSGGKLVRMVAAAPWEHRRELVPSILLAAAVATTATLLGGAAAWRLRDHDNWCRIATPLLAAGLVIPGPVLGILTIRLLNQPADSPLSGLTWLYDRTWLAPWLVQTVRVTPLTVLVLWPPLASVPRGLIDAARSEGAGPWGALWRVALPIRWPAVLSAWVVALAASVGELAATLLVLPPGPQTATVRIFSLLHYGVEDRVAALSLFMIGGYVACGAVAAWLLTRGRTGNPP